MCDEEPRQQARDKRRYLRGWFGLLWNQQQQWRGVDAVLSLSMPLTVHLKHPKSTMTVFPSPFYLLKSTLV